MISVQPGLPEPTATDMPAMDVAGRLGRLRALFDAAGCDSLVVTKLVNVAYLTGFTGSAGMLLVTGDGAWLATDSRYRDQAPMELATAGVEAQLVVSSFAGQLEGFAGALAVRGAISRRRRVGVESASISWSLYQRLAKDFSGATLVSSEGLVESLRAVKDAGEIARVEAACKAADVALAQVKAMLHTRPTEAQFAAELEYEMRKRGSSKVAFETIVASGPNAAMPHARPTSRTVEEGDLVVVDFGATVDGYRSDMTRTLCPGQPDPQLAELVEAVLRSQRAGLLAVKAGQSGADVDAACRRVLTDAGLGEAFLHGTGHGVGLEIHEAPSIGQGSADSLAIGSVITIEPGAYLKGLGGARIEDTVVVGAEGPRVLTRSTKDFTL